ncbi:unnamed protein product [Haemonchus placei]|uniref:F-box domain-containing protein n=1 Tax=Haemonchus placei TaxID=6290 RepID=A0A0N4W1N0_HAEPC|nr:unnamed protein product [Haemonchus placei]
MMRIKEAIHRRKLIHEMNEEVKDVEIDVINSPSSPLSFLPVRECEHEEQPELKATTEGTLHPFVQYLLTKMSEFQKRALKVTWKRLSEAPKTSGRGTIHIMEKVCISIDSNMVAHIGVRIQTLSMR